MHFGDDGSIVSAFRSLAGKHGAEIHELDISRIKPRNSVRLKCQVPLCEYYNVCKTCPPNIPTVEEFREILKDYTKAFLIVLREKIDDIETYRTDFSAELKLAELINGLELEAFQHGLYGAMGLCVGGCKYCTHCTPSGEPCRHPFKARPSPEGFGIDITELARETGVDVEWPPREYVNFMGLLFV